MSNFKNFWLVFAFNVAPSVIAECPNACSGSGECSNFDQCTCHRNWQGADCSQRTCQFGLAHVDTPKGDLDSSTGKLSGPDNTVLIGSTVYPFGTQEQFPNMTDSEGGILPNSAHFYMECSNKGSCDRGDGMCKCFIGYEGSSCQRASCPNACSGHGTCESIKSLAASEADNIYELWDAELTMGCACDAGFSGPDCSTQLCKYGVDPLYVDDESTSRVESVTYRLQLNSTDDRSNRLTGIYALKYFDVFGEGYLTAPIEVGASCSIVQEALENLPRKVSRDAFPRNSYQSP